MTTRLSDAAPNPATSADAAPVDAAPTRSTPAPAASQRGHARPVRPVQPVLEKLFELYPHLFGAEFLPLKLGIFQELLAQHPEQFQRDSLKAALGVHTRSTRYLQCVAAGKARHDLQGAAVEPVAPEHVFLAQIELFRRRQARTKDDLRHKLRAQLITAFEATGLSRQDYRDRMPAHDTQALALLDEALADHDAQRAREEALLRAFDASGQTVDAFADMYGMPAGAVKAALARRRGS